MVKENEVRLNELEFILYRLNLSNKVLEELVGFIKSKFDFIEAASIQAYEGEIPNFKIWEYDSFTKLAVVCFKLIVLKEDYKGKGNF